jgi:hypothetical protein
LDTARNIRLNNQNDVNRNVTLQYSSIEYAVGYFGKALAQRQNENGKKESLTMLNRDHQR